MKNCCIVFDVDGTLFDTKNGIIKTLNYVLKEFGKDAIDPQDEDKYIGPPIKKSLMKYQCMEDMEADEATILYRRNYVECFVHESVMYDGVIETLEALKNQNVILGIATMKTMPQLEALLIDYKCSEFFSVLKAAKEDGSLSKTQMLKDIKEIYPMVKYFLMIGDTRGDYQSAKEAGYCFVAADYGYGEIKDLNAVHISKITDLLDKV